VIEVLTGKPVNRSIPHISLHHMTRFEPITAAHFDQRYNNISCCCCLSVDVVVCDMCRLKESSSSVDGSKGHAGSNTSLHRATSLSLPSLTHRSKSFQSKLNFGDTSDDIHVGVQCMRAIMNNQVELCHGSQTHLGVRATLQDISLSAGHTVFRDDKMQ